MTTPPPDSMQAHAIQAPPDALAARFARTRAETLALAAPLSAEDCQVQSMPTASPVKWHLAHTTWFFETFFLERDPGYRPFHPEFRHLFNSYLRLGRRSLVTPAARSPDAAGAGGGAGLPRARGRGARRAPRARAGRA